MKRFIIGWGVFFLLIYLGYNTFGAFKHVFLSHFGAVTVEKRQTVYQNNDLTFQTLSLKREFIPFRFKLYVFEFNPKKFNVSIVNRRENRRYLFEPGKENIFLMNANYFNKKKMPTLMLKQHHTLYSPKRNLLSGFFWCKNGACDIQHITRFKDSVDYDIVVQSTPRLITNGRLVEGVKDLATVDTRSGVGVTRAGNMVFYATDNEAWAGLSYQELRDIFINEMKVKHLMSLDGGSSVQFYFHFGEIEKKLSGQREIPFAIKVTPREP